jgi:hypothetical protein
MELTWINKLRIAAVAALGIVVLGLLAWPLAAPADPLSPVRAWSISPFGTMTLLILALGLGFAGYFIAWPHGREIGILAVPFGLLVWAGRSGPMRVLTQGSNESSEREALASSLRFEPIYWLLIVAAGFAGVLLAQRLRGLAREEGKNVETTEGKNEKRPQALSCLPACFAVAATVLLAHFFVGVLAQNVATSHNATPTQPQIGQIIFAVICAFAVAGFLIKKFTNLSYVWPAIGSAFITGFAQVVYSNALTVRQFAETRPATFFAHSSLTILPVQFVVLGTLGSILGYWMAVRYEWWRSNESGL